jgi:hypothetical protein
MWNIWTSVAKKVRFWANKLSFMFQFAWLGYPSLVREEWKITQEEWEDVEKRAAEIDKEAAERLFVAIRYKVEKEESIDP